MRTSRLHRPPIENSIASASVVNARRALDGNLLAPAQAGGGHFMSSTRSEIMRAVPRRDTGPELAVRRLLHRLGLRFRLHREDLPGTPDIVLPKHRTVLFVHGCYWHRHQGCRFSSDPKTNQAFWETKFASNMERDARKTGELKALGWRVLVVWSCETRDLDRLAARLESEFSVTRTDVHDASNSRR